MHACRPRAIHAAVFAVFLSTWQIPDPVCSWLLVIFLFLSFLFYPDCLKTYSQYSDNELFGLIAWDDGQAFTEIYVRYAEKLYPHVSRLLDSDGWAEEIVQDVFVKLWQARHLLTGIDSPSAYIYRMAGNRTLDFLKRRATEVKAQYIIARQSEQHQNSDGEQRMDFKNVYELYRKAVDRLPAQKKIIFQLRHEQGLSYEEIAQQLQLSRNTVRNQLARAMESVRTYLLEQGIFPAVLVLAFLSGK
jgi:RNA polymerase sigma-70 factor (family 1)